MEQNSIQNQILDVLQNSANMLPMQALQSSDPKNLDLTKQHTVEGMVNPNISYENVSLTANILQQLQEVSLGADMQKNLSAFNQSVMKLNKSPHEQMSQYDPNSLINMASPSF